jgi:hypothetical protein
LNSDITRWRKTGATQMMYLNDFRREFGMLPALSPYGPGFYAFYNDWFFDESHDALNEKGVIPVARYVTSPFNGFSEIAKGKHDDTFKSLAGLIAKNGVPMVMIPYPSTNETTSQYYPWGGRSASSYVKAYIRMHDIFESEGANKNVIWSTKLKLGAWSRWRHPSPFPYIPPAEYVDWIGWQVNNHAKPGIGLDYQSFKQLMMNVHDKAAVEYADKPQMLWEISSPNGKYQAKWYDDAMTAIPKEYPWIKGVVIDVMTFVSSGRYGNYNPTLTDESKEVLEKHFNSGKFRGAYTDGSITVPRLKT